MRVLSALACAALLSVSPAVAPAAPAPLTIDGSRQLFIDDYLIEKMDNCRLLVHPGVKDARNPLPAGVGVETVMRDTDGVWKAWYTGRVGNSGTVGLYATSPDGIAWTKPTLDVVKSGANIFFPLPVDTNGNRLWQYWYHPSVFHDLRTPDPEERYKMAIWGNNGMCVAFSADGVHFQPWGPQPLDTWIRDVMSTCWDPLHQRFMIFCQINVHEPPKYSGRVAGAAWSRDFRRWTPVGIVLRPDDQDPPGMQIHCMAAFWYESAFIGLPQMFRTQPERTVGKIAEDDEIAYMSIQLATSRDGERWQRAPQRTPMIDFGSREQSAFDAGWIITSPAPIQVGDELWLYYHGGSWPQLTGGAARHTEAELAPLRKVERRGGMGIAKWRLDGFVSVHTDGEGTLTTKPLAAAGNELVLNADAAKGRLVVEILDEQGNPIKGLTAAEVQPMTSDELRHVVKFAGQSDVVAPLANRAIRLRFHLKDADLYSFQFRGAPVAPVEIGLPQETLAQLPPMTTEAETVQALQMALPFPEQGRLYDAKRIARAAMADPNLDGWAAARPLLVKLAGDELQMFDEIEPVMGRWLGRNDLGDAERADLAYALATIYSGRSEWRKMYPLATALRDNPAASPDRRLAMADLIVRRVEFPSWEQRLADSQAFFALALPQSTDRVVRTDDAEWTLRMMCFYGPEDWRKYLIAAEVLWCACRAPITEAWLNDWIINDFRKDLVEILKKPEVFTAYERYYREGGANPVSEYALPLPEAWTAPLRKIAAGRGDSPEDLVVRGRVAILAGEYKEAGRLFLKLYDSAARSDRGRRELAIKYLCQVAFGVEMRAALGNDLNAWYAAGAAASPDDPLQRLRKLVTE